VDEADLVVLEQQVGRQHGDPRGRQDAEHPVPQVGPQVTGAGHLRGGRAPEAGPGVRAIEQEAGHHEEQRDARVEAGKEPGIRAVDRQPAGEAHVRGDHHEGTDDPQPVEGREAGGPGLSHPRRVTSE